MSLVTTARDLTDWQEREQVCAERWELGPIEWLPDLSVNHVGFCQSRHGSAVLKVCVEPGIAVREAETLRHFGAELCPAVFETATDLECLLLERIHATHDLAAWYADPEREIDAWLPFCRAIAAHADVPDGFPTLADYARTFDSALSKSIPGELARLMARARDRREILMGSDRENRLLHGDLHHFNLLREEGGPWRMIDPHGVVGHPFYEMGAFLRNPWGPCYTEPGVRERLADRVSILADRLALPSATVAEYGFYGAAFSLAWDLEEGETFSDGMVVMAEACLSLMS